MLLSMDSRLNGSPLSRSLRTMLSVDFIRLLTDSMGLRSYWSENSSFRTLNFVSHLHYGAAIVRHQLVERRFVACNELEKIITHHPLANKLANAISHIHAFFSYGGICDRNVAVDTERASPSNEARLRARRRFSRPRAALLSECISLRWRGSSQAHPWNMRRARLCRRRCARIPPQLHPTR